MSGVGVWRWALGLATIGCSALQPSSMGPERSDVVWRELSSEHFLVCTDAGDEQARELMSHFEMAYTALRAILFREEGDAPEPMRVVLFAHGADLRTFVPASAAAAFVPAQPGDPASATIVVETSVVDDARQTFVHEITHAFVERWFGRVPVWLNEGLAQYFQSMRVEKGRIVLGEPISSYVPTANQMPALTPLITADERTFYAGTVATSVESLYQQSGYYAAAWFLVRLLMQDRGEYHRRFYRFLEALTYRVPAQAAWARSFDNATYRRLARDFSEYLRSDSFDTGFVAIDLQPASDVVRFQRVVGAQEMRLLWARLSRASSR